MSVAERVLKRAIAESLKSGATCHVRVTAGATSASEVQKLARATAESIRRSKAGPLFVFSGGRATVLVTAR